MLIALLPLADAFPVQAQSAENVAVVINQSSGFGPDRRALRPQARIPSVNVIRIKAPVQEEISRAVFTAASNGRFLSRSLERVFTTGSCTWC